MMGIFFELLYNLGILVSISIISGFIGHRSDKDLQRSLLQGVIFGSAAVIGMLHPLVVSPGLIFDGRSIMISISGLFFGPLTSVVAGLMALALRINQGGTGVIMGVLVIISSATIGAILNIRNKRRNFEIKINLIFFMGVIVHVVMILLMFTLPGGRGINTIRLMGVPILLTYPIATLLIGRILIELNDRKRMVATLRETQINITASNEELNASMEEIVAIEEELRSQFEELEISEERFRTIFEESPLGITLNDSATGGFIKVNSKFAEITGRTIEELIGIDWMSITHPEDIAENLRNVAMMRDKYTKGFNMNKRYIKPDGSIIWVNITIASLKLGYKTNASEICMVEDITERKHAEEALKASEYTFRTLFEKSSDPILLLKNSRIIDCNTATIKLLGYDSKTKIIGKNVWELSPEKQPDGMCSKQKSLDMKKIIRGNKKFEWWHQRADGRLLPVEIMMTTILLNGKEVYHALWRDISERKQMEQKLEYLSYHDQLTGLYNRRFYEEELKRLDVERNYPLSIIMSDVNGLKLINDSFGHNVGDELLKKVAGVMKNACRADDIIARLGGDEFVILLPKTDVYETEQVIRRIKEIAIKEKVSAIDISVSFGYETKRNENEKIEQIFKKAEDQMYKKKLFESPSMRGKTINAIINTLHEKNKREEAHSSRVSELCISMGKVLGLTEIEIEELKTVGLLHDIGKIAIQENILNKTEKLTEDEWKEIKRHPEIGYRILSTVNDMSEMANYILYHHERWDGKGYPKGLKKEEIPFVSRIITIVDAYDAMTSERSYRSALTETAAIQELQDNAGIQFNPELVGIFIEKVLGKSLNCS
jgi:diguanylate cyclase (GGDEF)-like protein/PAS domain S-box-containing protein